MLGHGDAKTGDAGSTRAVLACGGQLHGGAILRLSARLAQLRIDA